MDCRLKEFVKEQLIFIPTAPRPASPLPQAAPAPAQLPAPEAQQVSTPTTTDPGALLAGLLWWITRAYIFQIILITNVKDVWITWSRLWRNECGSKLKMTSLDGGVYILIILVNWNFFRMSQDIKIFFLQSILAMVKFLLFLGFGPPMFCFVF